LLAHRGRGGHHPVAAPVERLARGVEEQRGPVLVEPQAQVEVRVLAVDVGAPSVEVPLTVDQAVLERQGRPARVADGGEGAGGLDGEAAVRVEEGRGVDASPRELFDRGAAAHQGAPARGERLAVRRVPTPQLDEHTVGGAQAPVGAPAVFPTADEGDGAALALDGGSAERVQLAFQDLLEAEHTGGDQA
jgi:hypothetical protein